MRGAVHAVKARAGGIMVRMSGATKRGGNAFFGVRANRLRWRAPFLFVMRTA